MSSIRGSNQSHGILKSGLQICCYMLIVIFIAIFGFKLIKYTESLYMKKLIIHNRKETHIKYFQYERENLRNFKIPL